MGPAPDGPQSTLSGLRAGAGRHPLVFLGRPEPVRVAPLRPHFPSTARRPRSESGPGPPRLRPAVRVAVRIPAGRPAQMVHSHRLGGGNGGGDDEPAAGGVAAGEEAADDLVQEPRRAPHLRRTQRRQCRICDAVAH